MDISFKIDGITVANPLDFRFKASLDTPCSSLELSFLTQQNTQIYNAEMAINSDVLFTGFVDNQIRTQNQNGDITVLTCRSDTARMLDNEAYSGFHFNVTPAQMFDECCAPYGVVSGDFPQSDSLNFVYVRDGTSLWGFMELYCRQRFGKQPFIDYENKLTFTRFTDVTHQFNVKDTSAPPQVISCTTKYNTYDMISKLYVKTGDEEWRPIYGMELNNALAGSKNIRRTRYYKVQPDWVRDMNTASQMYLNRSNESFFSVELIVPNIEAYHIGDSVVYNDGVTTYQDLYIHAVELVANAKGAKTKITCYDKNFIV